MTTPRLVLLLALAGCPQGDATGKDAGPDRVGDTDTDTDTDADTDTDVDTADTGPPPGPPDAMTVVCASTDNPLRQACTITVEPAQPVQLTATRVDGLSSPRVFSSDEVATIHTLGVYFLAPLQDYDVQAIAVDWPDDGVATAFTTGEVPDDVASRLDMTGTATFGFLGSHAPCSGEAGASVYDAATGDLVWFALLDPGGQFGANDMVQFTEDFTVLGESQGDVIEVDLMGNELLRLDDQDAALGVSVQGIFGNFHHDIFKRDGIYYVMFQEDVGPAVLDTVVLFDGTGAELARWRPSDHLTMNGSVQGDYLHTNTIFVDTAGDIHLVWLGQDAFGKITGDWSSPDFGTVQWVVEGRASGLLAADIVLDWSALGVGADPEFSGPHSLVVRDDGRYTLLDNNHGRALVMTLDPAAGTGTVDGEYPAAQSFCGPQGTARATASGNVLVGCSGATVRELNVDTGALLWQAEVTCTQTTAFGASSSRWYPLDGW